ncbi:F0F1 ATP synthase subunit B [Pandoraea communis]|uniref:ATP synthase subunit b n=1 Tax=Pandoraea communis TaxID=2508297 RepID=A0A5E4UQL4_9BURK|nr:ATP synthase F0 subunit B [Pandoraea communis]VVE02268.1 F0F1 ATP synthase subunit B [Pandoraea communis]
MHVDWWTLGLQTVNALVLVWILWKFLFDPVASIIAERQRTTLALLADAQAAKASAEQVAHKAALAADQLARQQSDAHDAIAAQVDSQKASMLAAAQADAEQLRAAARSEIASMRAAAEVEQGNTACALALDIAAKLLERLPAETRVSGFIDGLVVGLTALPEATRQTLCDAHDPLRLLVPRPLTSEELTACRTAIGHAVGCNPAISVAVTPALIAGLELESAHAVVRNSLRNDLACLKRELSVREGE